MTTEEIRTRFLYHAPTPANAVIHDEIRARFIEAVAVIDNLIPDSREKSLFVTKMEEAMFWANAAVARRIEP